MNARDALIKVVEEYGGFPKVEREMGKTRNYYKHLRYDQRSMNADTLASIADACGYDVLLRRRDDDSEIAITP